MVEMADMVDRMAGTEIMEEDTVDMEDIMEDMETTETIKKSNRARNR